VMDVEGPTPLRLASGPSVLLHGVAGEVFADRV
jgi:hypothetical protein